MKTHKFVERKVEVVDTHTCDFCGEPINEDKASVAGLTTTIMIWRQDRNIYDGDFHSEEVDMCPTCWDDKFKAFLACMNVEPRVE